MERGKSYNLLGDKCKVLKTFYLCKVSFRINLKWNVKKIFLISILHVHCNN